MCSQVNSTDEQAKTNTRPRSNYDILGAGMPSSAHLFVVIEEIDKDGMLVRKLLTTGPYADISPNTFGLFPKEPHSGVSLAEHLLGKNRSAFISSSSNFPSGGVGFQGGRLVFIDVNKALQSGAQLIPTEELVAVLEKYKLQYPHTVYKVNNTIIDVRRSLEVVMVPGQGGKIPPSAVWTPEQLAAFGKYARMARVVRLFSIILTAYDFANATERSIRANSIKPITAEGIRQAGGWGGAWLGWKVGTVVGASMGIETGPGAFATGAVGGLIFGAAGYFGADWIADYIEED